MAVTYKDWHLGARQAGIIGGQIVETEERSTGYYPREAIMDDGEIVPTNTLGRNVEEIMSLRADKAALESQIKDINEEIERLEYLTIQQLEAQGLEKVKVGTGTASLKVEMYPQVEDLDAIVKWAYENGRSDILQRRVSSAVFKEVFDQQGVFPDGVKTYQKKTLNYRKA